jgi:5-methylcytosine-specific restriction endonuclease McrA
MKISCTNCKKEVDRRPSDLKKSKTGNHFCSQSCAATYNNTLLRTGINHPNYKEGGNYYKYKFIKDEDAQCSRCGYNKYPEVLEIHHKDVNKKNNKLENLELLCPTCHVEEHFLNKTGKFRSKNQNDL